MVRITTTIALLLSVLSAASAKDCPPDRYPDCCASYGTASPNKMRNSFHVPDRQIPPGDVPVGFVCMGTWGCQTHGLEARCCKSSWKSWGGAGSLGVDCI
ncbi:hypothetical protein BKA65DRAFT_61806 [Rhexocercosporidium sp. MPI-PUGE-AT-0058]|nr:hypothetical protein BKA65DRAFT_61806 [Rhexocercosporidium sp. MPI-PUGE-AT-0058]